MTILDDTWDVSGLVGTGSHDFAVEPIFVHEGYTWQFTPGIPRGKHYRGPLYQFPLVALLRLPASAVALGIAQGAVDAWLALAPSKRAVIAPGVLRDQPLVQARIAEVVALVELLARVAARRDPAGMGDDAQRRIGLRRRAGRVAPRGRECDPSGGRGRPARVHAGRWQREL